MRGGNATLNAFQHSPNGTLVPNDEQRDVFALTLYPFLAVVEKTHKPRDLLISVDQGTGGVNGSRHNWPSSWAGRRKG